MNSIHSILNQSFRDFELIIVDDGSTDRTGYLLKSLQDKRIKIITTENQGISSALNTAIAHSQCPLIARIDSDDHAEPCRLEIQAHYMQSNPETVICGSYVNVIDTFGSYIYTFSELPVEDSEIRNYMNQKNPFVHPAVMFKRDIFEKCGGYSNELSGYFEDEYLWHQLLALGRGFNIPRPLTNYRVTPGSLQLRNPSSSYKRHKRSIIQHGVKHSNESIQSIYRYKLSRAKKCKRDGYLTLARLTLLNRHDYRRTLIYLTESIRHGDSLFYPLYALLLILIYFAFKSARNRLFS